MRFENWDVLLFPQVSGTPIQEFRTECFGVVTPIGVSPTVNTYIPSLACGTPFKISLHSWSKPVLSSPKTVRGHQVVLAMHVAIDGKTVAIQRINPDGNFPHQVFNSPVSRTVFPPFHRATMRSQLQLHVADNVGRITVGLSEGYFYVADGRPHFSPVKDVVTFKWIHAPQNLLRKAGIAWPNAALFKLQDATGCNSVPHMSYPVADPGSLTFPPSVPTTGDLDESYPQTFNQIVTDTSHIDLSDLTVDYLSSGYTYDTTDQMRNVSDVSMHTSCDQFPACVMDASDGDVLHMPLRIAAMPLEAPRGRKQI